jgi:hypothetical protein
LTAIVLITLDVLAVAVTLLAAWLWWAASQQRSRRISLHEEINAHDFNRLIVSMNRTQILNARAALASAAAAIMIACRLAYGLF